MDIQYILDKMREISLKHKDVVSFMVGNTWDQAASKSSDIYPAVWIEFPILVGYAIKNKKTYTFSFDVLMLPKQDDTLDEIEKISKCESIADTLMWAFNKYIDGMSIITMTGLTLRNINADIACGVRIDLTIGTARGMNGIGDCVDENNNFNDPLVK